MCNVTFVLYSDTSDHFLSTMFINFLDVKTRSYLTLSACKNNAKMIMTYPNFDYVDFLDHIEYPINI